MASMNKVFLLGNLTRDPELRRTPSGTAVCDLGLATNRKFRSQDGQDREETCFVNVTVWGRQAETCAEYLKKGAPLLVEGRLQYDEWEKDGQRQNRLRVVAERTQFVGGARGGGAPAGGDAAGAMDRSAPPADIVDDDDNLPF